MDETSAPFAGPIGNETVIHKVVDFSVLGITFSSKPLVIGGLAMEYYGIRKRGADIDCIVANDDYEALAKKFPDHRVDRWGDLYLSIHPYELLRSIFRFDYHFFSQGAVECEKCKVISAEKLLFMKVLAYDNQPEIEKHARDKNLMWDYFFRSYQNKGYVKNAMKHEEEYASAPGGIVLGGKYRVE